MLKVSLHKEARKSRSRREAFVINAIRQHKSGVCPESRTPVTWPDSPLQLAATSPPWLAANASDAEVPLDDVPFILSRPCASCLPNSVPLFEC